MCFRLSYGDIYKEVTYFNLLSGVLLPPLILCFHALSVKFPHGLNGKPHWGCKVFSLYTCFICETLLHTNKECRVWKQTKFYIVAYMLTNLPRFLNFL